MQQPAATQEELHSRPSDDLLSIGVCPRCVRRFLGSSDAKNVFSGSINSLQLPPARQDFAGSSKSPCIVCLGILEAIDDPETRDETAGQTDATISTKALIVQAVRREGHDFNTFSLEVTIPGVVLIREHALWQYLHKKYGSESWLHGRQASSHVVPLKDALKWSLIERLEKSLEAKFENTSPFRIVLLYKHPEASIELDRLGCTTAAVGRKRKHFGTNENVPQSNFTGAAPVRASSESGESLAAVQRCLSSMSSEVFSKLYPWPPPMQSKPCQCSFSCYRTAIYVGGRYLKFSRNISQTPWLIDEERRGDGSVQEIIADIVFPKFKADSYKFHAAGREDIDVRMLGSGRPFMLELANARMLLSKEELCGLQHQVNSSEQGWVKVRNLQLVGTDSWKLMLEGEAEKQKQYTAVVWLSRAVTEADIEHISVLKDLEIQQKTPVRVLHRRSPLVRPRIIHWMRCERIKETEQYLLLHLCAQAGTYIKEFVHGDLGRTYPNFGSILGCEAEILQLDVTDIKMDLFN